MVYPMRPIVLGLAMIPLRRTGFHIQREGADADPAPEGFKSFSQTQSGELANLCNWQNCQSARKSSEPRRIAPGVRGDPLFADQKECGGYR